MEEVKIWAVQDGSDVTELPTTNVDTEQLLENTLVENPDMLLNGLKLVGRQTPTDGGPLDLLGVDEDGKLVVFELKRGAISRDAVAQIIDYTSDLDAMGLDGVALHISQNSGKHGIEKIDNFYEWYDDANYGDLEGLLPPRMFLVGLGVDNRTERMVDFMANNSKLDISLLTFQGFIYQGKILLAKQVKIEGKETPHGGGPTREQLNEDLVQRSHRHGIASLYDEVKNLLGDNWPEAKLAPRKIGLSFRMRPSSDKGYRPYVRVDPEKGRVRLVFFRRAIELCGDNFQRALKGISYETYPKNLDPLDSKTPEVQFLFSPEEWSIHKELITELLQSVHEDLEEAG